VVEVFGWQSQKTARNLLSPFSNVVENNLIFCKKKKKKKNGTGD
jgi:hypothetical protein